MADDSLNTRNAKNIQLNRKLIIIIFIYYFAIMVVAGLYAMNLTLAQKISPTENAPFFLCLSLSAVGVSIYYCRKLYKACISDKYHFTEEAATAKMVGSVVYFVARPIFGFFFAWVSYMIWVTAIISSVNTFSGFSTNHFFLSGLLGFFVGFLVGQVVSKMETTGQKYLMGVV